MTMHMAKRGRAKCWSVQVNDDEDGWVTMETTDCVCFHTIRMAPCSLGCAVKAANRYEELEGQGNVRIIGAILGGVMWPLGAVIQRPVPNWATYRNKHDFDNTIKHEEEIL